MTVPRFPTEREFKAWRKRHPWAGAPSNPYRCPLAMFMADRGIKVAIRRDQWRLFRPDGALHPLPEWAQEFIRRFDAGEKV